eukprot:TRINITY_DN4098_c0_g2_i2.p1 TRINITY_DN4098_c0_g2~~TRINITY_DN4098_c0_g2_i2.p1  ORF type:complete len:670 (+),score=114.75 TRINITY_DN4098_c0_g2_i2:120-2012(+)
MTGVIILLLLLAQFTDVTCQALSCNDANKPNFLIVLTDDQGHDDIGYHNQNGILQTPNIDKFASQSVGFENFYTDSLCAPTRASLLTGRHHLKTGVWGVHGAMDYISLDETLISQVLQSAGYKTALYGKWHNGVTPGYNPWNRGFDIAYVAKLYVYLDNPMTLNGAGVEAQGWVEDWLADRIIDYLEERKEDGQPFFILWTPMQIHKGRLYDYENYETFIAPESYIQKYEGLVSADLARVYGAIEYFDSVFGRVISKLDELEMGSNTIVMLMGDNGPLLYNSDHYYPPNRNVRVPSDMKQEKGFVDENGILSFLFVRGLNRFPENKKIYENIHIMDIFPTVANLAGAQTSVFNKALDGMDFSPLLCQEKNWAFSDRKIFLHEVVKNSLKVDTLLNLNDDRLVDRTQEILKYYSGGQNGGGFQSTSAVKMNQYKFSKNNLFNIEENRQEYFDQRIFDQPELFDSLKNALSKWWKEILESHSAFQKPVFLIGFEWTSPVPAIGAIERSQYNIVITDHFIKGFKFAGDYLICPVRIVESGTYDVKLNFVRSEFWQYAFIKISVGKNYENWEGSAPSVAAEIGDSGAQYFGQISLKVTSGGGRDEMLIYLESIENEGQDLFAELWSVEFTKTAQ